VVNIEGLKKGFDGFVALNGLNLQISKGSIYGLVGVNGSGKTTVIKHLAGVYTPDEGSVTINGKPVMDNAACKASIGYVSDEMYFFQSYHIKSLRKFYKNMYRTWDDLRFDALIQLMGLDTSRRVGRFSKGMQKQTALALALSIKPDFLLLDEPIDGLDPIVRKNIFDWIIGDVAERTMTVLISSHNLKEMDGICDTVGIIKNGKMLLQSDLDELKTDMANNPAFTHLPPSLDEIFIYAYRQDGNTNDNHQKGGAIHE